MDTRPALSVTISLAEARLRRPGSSGDLEPVLPEGGRPMALELTVPGLPSQARAVRRYLHDLTAAQAVPGEQAVWLGSELFANAVLHSRSGDPGGKVTVGVYEWPDRIRVRIVDDGPRPESPGGPRVRPLDLDEPGGLGLRVVSTEAARWGVDHPADGRTGVWFDLDLPGPPRVGR
ncbi:anti-sigma regulatory factor (Ser/Thr protein kinase) [Nocardiopsis sp. Huas11]|uniref:ATP-binding protein n=1 Tax=Nocardiopsis sp. Huas11 TaxID=2183912 RepID=UPI000EB35716|nr:ATP-binding protein [Nocardiopsis sp. Huas11]RKS07168.1 anti-sigma regulatory factor (Ser/Thr protein kinase) [Nocardiopsis sp. Huas11]